MNPPPWQAAGPSPLRGGALVCLLVLLLFGGSHTDLFGQESDTLAVVQGQVKEHETGNPIAGAAVSLASGPGGTGGLGTRVTNEEGRFLFRRVPLGTYRLMVTFIGYRTLQDTLFVQGGSNFDLVLPMSVSPIELEPLVVVTDRRRLGPMAGFEERRRTRSGTFFDREYIENRQPIHFSDLFRMVPGARVVPTGPYGNTVRLRGNCRPSLWVDGMPLITEEDMDAILPPMDLEAVEVYRGPSLPVEFGSNPCGGILVWTRRGEPHEGGGSVWRKLGIAAGIISLILLIT